MYSLRPTVANDSPGASLLGESMTIAEHLRSILLSLWLGAALFFSFAVAPNVFATLRAFQPINANEMAGTIVTSTLAVINVGGFIVGLITLLITITFRASSRF